MAVSSKRGMLYVCLTSGKARSDEAKETERKDDLKVSGAMTIHLNSFPMDMHYLTLTVECCRAVTMRGQMRWKRSVVRNLAAGPWARHRVAATGRPLAMTRRKWSTTTARPAEAADLGGAISRTRTRTMPPQRLR